MYAPLKEDEIRLVKLLDVDDQHETIRLELEHFDLSQAPPFIALSYVWGDPNNPKPVSIQGFESFSVTRNLHNALAHMNEVSYRLRAGLATQTASAEAELYVWIDAICINQSDVAEKSKQVPRMTELYTAAYSVLIWFGTLDELALSLGNFVFLLVLLDMVDLVDGFPHQSRPSVQPPADADLGDQAVWQLQTYAKIMMSEWFKRVWVLQEYTLSRRSPSALIGPWLFNFQSLHGLGPNFEQFLDHPDPSVRLKTGPMTETTMVLAKLAFGPVYMRSRLRDVDFLSKSLASRLLWIYMNIGSKRATVPHDQLYGLFGLINANTLPNDLVPNYEQRFGDVCHRYTKFLINETRDLRLLAFTALAEELDGQPSWVVNFCWTSPWELEPKVKHSGVFSIDGEKLHVDGVNCGTILIYLARPVWTMAPTDNYSEGPEHLRDFYETIVTAAADIRDMSVTETWKQWFANFLQYSLGQSVHYASQYDTVDSFLASFTVGRDAYGRYSDGLDRDAVVSQFPLHDWALVSDGAIARCSRRRHLRPMEGASVYALKGAGQRYVMMPTAEREYEYLGWLTEVDVEIDKSYFTHHVTERVALV